MVVKTFKPARQFQQLGLGVDEQIDERQMAQGGFCVENGCGYARVSLRLLIGGLSPGLSHHSS
jgi:hypothetical protein